MTDRYVVIAVVGDEHGDETRGVICEVFFSLSLTFFSPPLTYIHTYKIQVSQSLPALAYAGGDPLVNPNTGTNGPLGLIATILFVFIPTAFLITVYLKDPGTEKDRFGTR